MATTAESAKRVPPYELRLTALSTHLLSGSFNRGKQQWTGYAWLHDDRDVASASAATYGLRWTGTQPQGELIWASLRPLASSSTRETSGIINKLVGHGQLQKPQDQLDQVYDVT